MSCIDTQDIYTSAAVVCTRQQQLYCVSGSSHCSLGGEDRCGQWGNERTVAGAYPPISHHQGSWWWLPVCCHVTTRYEQQQHTAIIMDDHLPALATATSPVEISSGSLSKLLPLPLVFSFLNVFYSRSEQYERQSHSRYVIFSLILCFFFYFRVLPLQIQAWQQHRY
jgi:hypothetical protein